MQEKDRCVKDCCVNIDLWWYLQVAKGLLDSGRRAQPPRLPVVTLQSAAPLAACSQLLHYRCACDAWSSLTPLVSGSE